MRFTFRNASKLKRDITKTYAKDKAFFHEQLTQLGLKFLIVLFVIMHYMRVDAYRFQQLTMLMPFRRSAAAAGFIVFQ